MADASVEVLALLVGPESDVLERLGNVMDQPMLVALHLAERRGRARAKVLEAIEKRGLALEMTPVTVAAEHMQEDIVRAVAGLQHSRPTAAPLIKTLQHNERYPVPADERFIDDHTGRGWDYMRAPDIEEMAFGVMRTYAEHLRDALDFGVQFLWKRQGGSSGGRDTMGKCQKVSGLAGFFAGDDFLIWLAADHCRDYGLTRQQMDALIFHELKHIGRTEKYQPRVVGHEVEMFIDEVSIFGAWTGELRRMAEQLELPL